MESSDALLAFLRAGRWFGGLPDDLQRGIVAAGRLRSFGKGALLIRHGAASRGMYALLAGRVHVTWPLGDDADALLHVGEPGLWLGDYALLARAPCMGNVLAVTPVRTLQLPVAAFERMVADEPRWYRCFATLTLERHALLYRSFAQSRGLPSEAWLQVRLRDIADMRRREADTERSVRLDLSQSELARMVGLSRQTLSTLLARLAARGLVEVGFRSIRVLDVDVAPARRAQ
jgi:CRP-like cAMP-binding protein